VICDLALGSAELRVGQRACHPSFECKCHNLPQFHNHTLAPPHTSTPSHLRARARAVNRGDKR
jgi:hypothetical protein